MTPITEPRIIQLQQACSNTVLSKSFPSMVPTLHSLSSDVCVPFGALEKSVHFIDEGPISLSGSSTRLTQVLLGEK